MIALVTGTVAVRRAEAVVVNGKVVVRDGRLLTGDETAIARDLAVESKLLASRARL